MSNYEKLKRLADREPIIWDWINSDQFFFVSDRLLDLLEVMVDRSDDALEIQQALAIELATKED